MSLDKRTLADELFAVIDTETTHREVEQAKVCELACVVTNTERVLGMYATLVNPGIPIPPESSAIHGIVDADVRNAPDLNIAMTYLHYFIERAASAYISPYADVVYTAYNKEYDGVLLQNLEPADRWLCAERLAKHLYPNAPNYKNQTLRYWLPCGNVEAFGIAPHRALGDALVTAHTFRYMLGDDIFFVQDGDAPPITTIAALFEYVNSPIILVNMPFGKWRGKISDMPLDYLEWAIERNGLTDIDDDLRYTLTLELRSRKGALPL